MFVFNCFYPLYFHTLFLREGFWREMMFTLRIELVRAGEGESSFRRVHLISSSISAFDPQKEVVRIPAGVHSTRWHAFSGEHYCIAFLVLFESFYLLTLFLEFSFLFALKVSQKNGCLFSTLIFESCSFLLQFTCLIEFSIFDWFLSLILKCNFVWHLTYSFCMPLILFGFITSDHNE